MKVIVIGGGPAGMMAAITAAESGDKVILIEKMESLGRKLLITGKGRCNITSSVDMNEFIKNTPGNGMFLYSAFSNFTNLDIIEFLKGEGLEVKKKKEETVFFPVTDKSLDVLKCFTARLKELKVEIKLHTKVKEIVTERYIKSEFDNNGEENRVIGIITENGEKDKSRENNFSDRRKKVIHILDQQEMDMR